MIDLLIKKIVEENDKLEKDKFTIENNNFIYEILSKVLNRINISTGDTTRILNLIKQDLQLTDLEKETLEFVFLVLIPNNIQLEQVQKELLNKLLIKYSIKENDELSEKINQNNKLMLALQSEEIFLYFDELNIMFNEYDINLKDRLKIIKTLIHKNYSVQLKQNNISSSIIEEGSEHIDITDDISKSEESVSERVFESREEVISFFKTNKLYYARLDDNLKERINNYGLNIEEATNIIEMLKSIGVNIKHYYNNNSENFINLILFSRLEYINEVISMLHKRNIELKKLLTFDTRIFYSDEYGGLLENFKNNIIFLDSLDYDYRENTDFKLYYMTNEDLKNAYHLYTKVYRFRLGDLENICFLMRMSWTPILDRLIEISGRTLNLVDQTEMDIFNTYKRTLFYGLKIIETTKGEQNIIDKLFFLGMLRSDNGNLKLPGCDDIQEEKTELNEQLNAFFEPIEDGKDHVMYAIPHSVKIDPEILNNEYVDYLETNYKSKDLVYIFNRTRVSRIKVLRILSYLNSRGIVITQDVVKYALKFNYIYIEKDLDNINSVFKAKEKNWK